MNYTYVLSHGFGFSDKYWRNLVPLLDGEVVYFNKNLKTQTDKNYIGIGHSLGFSKLNNSEIKFRHLIGLQGFLNFCGSDRKMRLIRENNLNKLIQKFKIDCGNSLKNFYKICGYPFDIPKNINETELINELESMKLSNTHCGTKTTIIGSSADQIVPLSIIEDNFSNNNNIDIKYIDGVTHSLGFNNPAFVIDVIKKEVLD